MASEKRPQRELDEALWDAAEAGDVEACKALKAEGANVNWTHPMAGVCLHALHCIAWLAGNGGSRA